MNYTYLITFLSVLLSFELKSSEGHAQPEIVSEESESPDSSESSESDEDTVACSISEEESLIILENIICVKRWKVII